MTTRPSGSSRMQWKGAKTHSYIVLVISALILFIKYFYRGQRLSSKFELLAKQQLWGSVRKVSEVLAGKGLDPPLLPRLPQFSAV